MRDQRVRPIGTEGETGLRANGVRIWTGFVPRPWVEGPRGRGIEESAVKRHRIEIQDADITDWSYVRDGKYVGMATRKPRFEHMPAAQVEAFKRVVTRERTA